MTSTPSDMLSEMSDCAYRLGVAVAARAEATEDWGRKLELIQVFDRCFFSVRVSIALQLRLRREAGAEARAPQGVAQRTETERDEGLEIERAEALERPDGPDDVTHDDVTRGGDAGLYTERDRDRETERASLPLLLSTLNGVADAAGALPGPAPAALPALRELLARVGAETPAALRAPTPRANAQTGSPANARINLLAGARAGPAAPLRTRLAGSAVATLEAGPPLRATGPPRRR